LFLRGKGLEFQIWLVEATNGKRSDVRAKRERRYHTRTEYSVRVQYLYNTGMYTTGTLGVNYGHTTGTLRVQYEYEYRTSTGTLGYTKKWKTATATTSPSRIPTSPKSCKFGRLTLD
jgi:hypothetical protein